MTARTREAQETPKRRPDLTGAPHGPDERLDDHRGCDPAHRGRFARARRPAPARRGAASLRAPRRPRRGTPRPTTVWFRRTAPQAARGRGASSVPELGGGRARHVRSHQQHGVRRLVGDLQAPASAHGTDGDARPGVRHIPRRLRQKSRHRRTERQGCRPVRTSRDAHRDGGARGGCARGVTRHADQGHHQGQPGNHGHSREAHRAVVQGGSHRIQGSRQLCQILRRAKSRGGGHQAKLRPSSRSPRACARTKSRARGSPRRPATSQPDECRGAAATTEARGTAPPGWNPPHRPPAAATALTP